MSEYRNLLIVLSMHELSIFRGIAVSLLRPVIGSNVEIERRTQTNSPHIQMIVQIFHFKLNSIYSKCDFHSHHKALASLGNTSTNGMFVQYF